MSCAYWNIITQGDGCGAAHLRIFWTSFLWAKCKTSHLNDKEILCRMAVVWQITFLSRWKGAETEVTVTPLGSNVYFPCKSRHRPSCVVIARIKGICTAKLHKAAQPPSAADTTWLSFDTAPLGPSVNNWLEHLWGREIHMVNSPKAVVFFIGTLVQSRYDLVRAVTYMQYHAR